MPKKRQIPFLFPQGLADGTIVWHWKPSPRLRRAGFVNVKLGLDHAAAVARALELNAGVDAWAAGQAPPGEGGAAAVVRAPPRVVRFAELVSRYRASDAFKTLKASTRGEYGTRLRQLDHWALDGRLVVRDIDYDLVRDLRNALVANASPWRAASTLRVLRLLLAYAEDERIIPRKSNPAVECDIPEPPARKMQMTRGARDAIVAAAEALGLDDVAFAVPLAFWMLQRQADILGLSRIAWRELDMAGLDLEARHAARLVDAKGRAMSFRLAQQKTGTWIDAPIPPHLCAEVDRRFRAGNSGYLFPDLNHPDKPMPGWQFQRAFREAQGAAWAVALMDGRTVLAAEIAACQFRDLRRTGMIAYGDAGAKIQWITALSGHAVLGRKTIMDTYMPGDTAGACACVATGLAAMLSREQKETSSATVDAG